MMDMFTKFFAALGGVACVVCSLYLLHKAVHRISVVGVLLCFPLFATGMLVLMAVAGIGPP